jgi:hypothetical protein
MAGASWTGGGPRIPRRDTYGVAGPIDRGDNAAHGDHLIIIVAEVFSKLSVAIE